MTKPDPRFMLGSMLNFPRYYLHIRARQPKIIIDHLEQDGQLVFFKSNEKDPINTITIGLKPIKFMSQYLLKGILLR